MNTSSEFIGFAKGKEIHGLSEYDPLGKTVTPLLDGKVITKWHLLEAIENMHDADAEFMSKMLRKNSETVMGRAICMEALMEIVKKYWAEVEERIEGKSS